MSLKDAVSDFAAAKDAWGTGGLDIAASESRAQAAIDSASDGWVEQMTELKELGNKDFKAGKNSSACISYRAAIAKGQAGVGFNAKEKSKPLLLSLHSNLAAAELKLEHWEEAAAAASAALELEPAHAKALYRRGLARSKLGALGGAKDDLLAACKADPKDKAARTELAAVQAALKANPFAKAFGGGAGGGLYAEEERRETQRKKAVAERVLAEEAELRADWKKECSRLRQERRDEKEKARQARLNHGLAGEAPPPEEKRILSSWAKRELQDQLRVIEYEEPDAISEVALVLKCEGSASSTQPRSGGTGRPSPPKLEFEYSFELEWRAFSRSDSKTLCMGTLTYTKVKPVSDSPVDSPNGDSPSRTVSVGKEREKLAHYFGMKKERANALAAELKKLVAKALEEFHAALRLHAAKTGGSVHDDKVAGGDDSEPPPISFEAFKEQREAKAKEEKAKLEEKEKKRKEAEEEARRRARKEEQVVVVDDEDDLKDVRGYKKRSDGSTTSFFDREIDAETKAVLDAQKAPKRIDPASSSPSAAAPSAAPGGGSAWNAAGTWEEKDFSEWVRAEAKARLLDTGVNTVVEPGVEPYGIKVHKVSELEGSASVNHSRGKTRHLFELSFEIEWKAVEDATNDVGSGKLIYADVSPTSATEDVGPGGVSFSVTEKCGYGQQQTTAGVRKLKANVHKKLDELLVEYRATKHI